ncbi:MAG: chorismate-binding protein, partial [Cyclobacteriaceae bacterium]
GKPVLLKPELNHLPPGFMFSRFDNQGLSYYLKAEVHITFSHDQMQTHTGASQNFLEHVNPEKEPITNSDISYFTSQNLPPRNLTDYQILVQKAIEAIKAKEFLKVVPSRYKSIDLSKNFNLVHTFQLLCERYPNAFVSLVSIPQIGTWMGASPEILIKTDASQHFFTAAVAGTQAYQPGLPMWEVLWRQKEIEEQAMVSRYIIDCFKKIRLREFCEDGPKTAQAGKMVHLRTDFAVDMEATNFPQLGNVMLELLHPTSAICGMPRKPAFEFLQKNEGYDREFYSGFLGPVNMQNATDIFVNIRCMQLWQDKAIVYAGAGVTRYSNPQQEWQETEMKCNTMLDVLQE